MQTSNYSIADLVGGLSAVFLFIPVLMAPGYVVGWAFNCFGFRTLTAPWRFQASIPLSVAVCPILTYWLGSLLSWMAVWVFYSLLLCVWLALLAGAFGHEKPGGWFAALKTVPRITWIIAATWCTVALLSLVDIQIGDRLYYSVTAYDYSIRTAVTDAITRTGARPSNPLYFVGGPAPLRYHYFWFLLCSAIDRMGGQTVDARQAIFGSAVWGGWALIASVPLYLRFLCGWAGAALQRRAVLAIAFFAITGLDILPTAILWFHGLVHADMEWWNMEVTSWWGSALWVPHHVAALVAGLTGFLVLWHSASQGLIRSRIGGSLFAGLAFASMLGSSIDVAFVFAVFLGLWTVVAWVKRDRSQARMLAWAGVVAAALAIPYLESLTGLGAGGPFVKFTIRSFSPLDAWAGARHLSLVSIGLLRLFFLPLNYFLELGFFLVVGVAQLVYLRERRTLARWDLAMLLLALVSVLMCTFLRSGVVADNDLGMRGFLPAQFVLLLWAADLFSRRGEEAKSQRKPFHRWWLRSAIWAPVLFLGLAGTIYEMGILRLYGIMADAGVCAPGLFSPDPQLGRRTYALRNTYEELKRQLPQAGVVQNNPDWGYYDFTYGNYANRQTAMYDRQCGAQFGGDPKACQYWFPSMAGVFGRPEEISAGGVESLCNRLGIGALVLKDVDPAWRDHRSWAWQMQPAISTVYTRVYLFPRNSKYYSRRRFNGYTEP